LIVSRGWHTDDSTKPAVPPAIKCWIGFFFFFGLFDWSPSSFLDGDVDIGLVSFLFED